MKKKIIEYLLLFVVFVILINLFTSNIIEIQEASNYIYIEKIIQLHFLSSLYIVIMGLLIERHLIVKMITTRKVAIRPLFFIGVLMLIMGSLHATFYMKIGVYTIARPFPLGGIGFNMLVAPLYQGSSVQHIITLLATLTIIRGLVDKKTDNLNA